MSICQFIRGHTNYGEFVNGDKFSPQIHVELAYNWAFKWDMSTIFLGNYQSLKLEKGRFWNFTSFGTLPILPLPSFIHF